MNNRPSRRTALAALGAAGGAAAVAMTDIGTLGVILGAAPAPGGARSDWVDVRSFGAMGVGDESLHPTHYVSDIRSSPVLMTRQTVDGIAINNAIRSLRAAGGGTLFFPKGEYRTYGYLEPIDFPLQIVGEGRQLTRIANCRASPTRTNGYGILIVYPVTPIDIAIRNLTLDGRVLERLNPGDGRELRNYPLAIYGTPRITLENITSVNSPIDCLMTAYANSAGVFLRATNCLFSNAFRNTVSNVAGWNQYYSNCVIEKGGAPFGGTNPKYCLDIEPNAAANTIKNLTYTNCTFREAVNVIAGGIWAGNVHFNSCAFKAYGGPAFAGSTVSQPYLTDFRGGEFTFSDCTFEFLGGDYNGEVRFSPSPNSGDYVRTEFVRLERCRISGAGIGGYGRHMVLQDLQVQNSLRPLIFGGNGTQNLSASRLRLTNVFDPTSRNAGGGAYSSLALNNQFEGAAIIDQVQIEVEPSRMPAGFPARLAATNQAYGFYNGAVQSAAEIRLSNIHCMGFYRRLPSLIGKPRDANNFRDWGSPSLPASGETAGEATSCRNCTMHGDRD